MRDIHVDISVGTKTIGVLVYQGTKSPHTGGGIRVLHNTWVELGEPAHMRRADDVLARVGEHLVRVYGDWPERHHDVELPFEEEKGCGWAEGCKLGCDTLEDHTERTRAAAWPPYGTIDIS